MAAVIAALLLLACGGSEPAPLADEVVACTDLRTRANELIVAANATMKEFADADDPVLRAEVLTAGFDELVAILDAQVDTVHGDTEVVTEALRHGAEKALDAMKERRQSFVDLVDEISDSDERGRAATFLHGLEKALAEMEPSRAVYEAAGMARQIDADAGCRFVTERANPSSR